MLHVGDAPVKLLRAVRGMTLVDLPDKEQCCGFGGTFAVKNADVSAAMLTEKDTCVLSTGAEVVTALDNSCLMQIYGGLHRAGSHVRTMHLAEILASEGGSR
jgi:L-lactate dehydrogenase complex protein LldE